jgi:hypothetical protein
MLALSLVHEFPPGSLYGNVEVITVASGATHPWSGQSAPGYSLTFSTCEVRSLI